MLAFVSAPGGTQPGALRANVGAGRASQASPLRPEASGADGKLALGVAAAVAGLTVAARRDRRRGEDTATQRHFDEKDIGSPALILAAIKDNKEFREKDRETRRPVFGYGDWVRHRSEDRFVRNLSSLFVSRISQAIWLEVLCPTVVALLIVISGETNWTSLLGANAALLPAINISALPFTISSASLSLLLVFKTNQSYDRWWEARIVWGAIVNKCRDMTRQSLARIDTKKHPEEQEAMVKLTAAFPRILHYHLSEQTPEETEKLADRLSKLLPEDQAKKIMSATHKPMTLCGIMSKTLERSGLELFDKLKFDKILTDFADYYGMCERIFKTPIPLAYTRLTARFLTVWLLFMPFALYSQINPHWMIVPITAIISLFIFGIEELGVMIEEPFSVLPLEKIGDGIQASMFEALELHQRKKTTEERAAIASSNPFAR